MKDSVISESSSSTLGDMFSVCSRQGRAAFIAYLPVGYPTCDISLDLFRVLVDSGCDLIEVGVPYSDPVMDGPVIENAGRSALDSGVRIKDVFTAVETITQAGGKAVVMSYWNPLLQYGIDSFSRDLASVGGLGIITPNLIPEEAGQWLTASRTYNLDRIFLAAPSSSNERIALICQESSGFVYAASTMGVTGARDEVSHVAPELVARIRAQSDIPVAVGLGVRSPEHVAQIAQYADGVIAGSVLVSTVQNARDDVQACHNLSTLTKQLVQGVYR